MTGTGDKSHDCLKLSSHVLLFCFFIFHVFNEGLDEVIVFESDYASEELPGLRVCACLKVCGTLGLNSDPSIRISKRGLGDLLKRLPSDSDDTTVLEC